MADFQDCFLFICRSQSLSGGAEKAGCCTHLSASGVLSSWLFSPSILTLLSPPPAPVRSLKDKPQAVLTGKELAREKMLIDLCGDSVVRLIPAQGLEMSSGENFVCF